MGNEVKLMIEDPEKYKRNFGSTGLFHTAKMFLALVLTKIKEIDPNLIS